MEHPVNRKRASEVYDHLIKVRSNRGTYVAVVKRDLEMDRVLTYPVFPQSHCPELDGDTKIGLSEGMTGI